MWRKDGIMSDRRALEDNTWSVSFNEKQNEMKCLSYQPIIPTILTVSPFTPNTHLRY